MEFGLQLRHLYTQSNLSLSQGESQRGIRWGMAKISQVSSASQDCGLLTAQVIVLSVCLFTPGALTAQVHRLCLLQIWGKRARGGGSIQARQSEWPMTVQDRRKLRKKTKHVTTLLLNPMFTCWPCYTPRG